MDRHGFVYLLGNPCMPLVFKIGRTTRSVSERARQLSASTSVPVAFRVLCYFETNDAGRDEAQLHEVLADFRVSPEREFFRFAPIHMPWVQGLFEYYPGRLAYEEVALRWFVDKNVRSDDPENPWDRYDYEEPVMTKYPPLWTWEMQLVE